jgi:flagellar export protein FliJ
VGGVGGDLVCALKAVVDLREKQRDAAALELAAQRRRRDAVAAEMAAAVAARDAVPTTATSVDMLDLYDRASRAAERRVIDARSTLNICEKQVAVSQEEHRQRTLQHQSMLRIVERRDDDADSDLRRRERRTHDDLAGRRVAAWL